MAGAVRAARKHPELPFKSGKVFYQSQRQGAVGGNSSFRKQRVPLSRVALPPRPVTNVPHSDTDTKSADDAL